MALFRLVLLALVATLGAAGNASADLIDLGTSTRDTVTNLDWLDLEETAGLSYNEVIVSSLVTSDGWRYATESEACAFLGGSCPGAGTITRPELLDLWNPFGQISAIYDASPSPGFHYLVSMGPITPGDLDYLVGVMNFNDSNSGQNGVGSLLVRSVPEPGTGSLVGLGLIGLSLRRRGTLLPRG